MGGAGGCFCPHGVKFAGLSCPKGCGPVAFHVCAVCIRAALVLLPGSFALSCFRGLFTYPTLIGGPSISILGMVCR